MIYYLLWKRNEREYAFAYKYKVYFWEKKTANDECLWEGELGNWRTEVRSIYFSLYILLYIFKLHTICMYSTF